MQTRDSLARQLLPILEPLQSQIKNWHCRVVPSAFDSDDEALRAIPLAREWAWESVKERLLSFKPQTLILQLPSFWQVEPFAHYAARAAGATVCVIETQNFPLDKAAIRLASADAVFAEATEAADIAEYLVKENIELPPYWILAHRGDAESWKTPQVLLNRTLEVAAEVHLAPGIPLLVQCESIVAKQSGLFHHSNLFTWSADLAAPTITAKEPMLFMLTRFPLPFRLKAAGACNCGQALFARD